jgi:Protein of unknown function (DUF1207)
MGRIAYKRLIFWIIIFISIHFSVFLYADTTNYEFLAEEKLFPAIFLDPFECQLMGGLYTFSGNDSLRNDIYSMVNIGISKPIFTHFFNDITYEFALEFASYTQFEIDRIDSKTSLGGLLNNDYRIGFAISTLVNSNYMRIRFFHISSHLGDDYIIRNNIDIPNDRSQNYEQLDLTFLRKHKESFAYLGLGYIVSKYVYRKRFSSQIGGMYTSNKANSMLNQFIAMDLRILQEENFEPSLRTSIGIDYVKNQFTSLKLWIEYNNGFIPYSTLDFGRISWFGLGMSLTLI